MRFLSFSFIHFSFVVVGLFLQGQRCPHSGCKMVGPTMAMDRGPWTISTRQLTDPHINLIPRFLSFFFLFLFFSSQIAPFYAFSTTQQTTPHTTKSTPRLQTGSAISRTVRGKENYSTTATSLNLSQANETTRCCFLLTYCTSTDIHSSYKEGMFI